MREMTQKVDVDLTTRVQMTADVYAVPGEGVWVGHAGQAYQLFTETHLERTDTPISEAYFDIVSDD
jgi:hypothetical protein